MSSEHTALSDVSIEQLLQVLFRIGKAIGSDEDLASLLHHISEQVCELVGADACSIMLLDAPRDRLLAKASYGLRVRDLNRVSFAVGEGVAGWVMKHREAALIGDVEQDERFVSRRETSTTIRSMASVPLEANGEPVGVLNATSGKVNDFTAIDLEMLRVIARTIALDIENRRLRRMSVTDPLTGTYNREFMQQRLPVELAAADQKNQPLSLAMIDVDHFKQVNDQYGHTVGDHVLVAVADRLRSAIRGDDFLIRYGGEEFMVLLPNADAARALEVGERMRLRLADSPIAVDGVDVEVRISVGVAQYHGAQEPADTLIRRADTALYSAKGRGRNRVEIAP